MNETHDYETRKVKVGNLTNENVLVGESGGLSAVYRSVFLGQGMHAVATEHGTLIFDVEAEVDVLVA